MEADKERTSGRASPGVLVMQKVRIPDGRFSAGQASQPEGDGFPKRSDGLDSPRSPGRRSGVRYSIAAAEARVSGREGNVRQNAD